MKRLLITMMLLSSFALAQAQNDLIINIDDAQDYYELCVDHYDRIVAYPEEGCNSFYWRINGGSYNYDNPLIIVIADYLSQHPDGMFFNYYGCDISYKCVDFGFYHSVLPNDTTMVVWKRQNETGHLEAPSVGFDQHWSTGEDGMSIDPTETGTYTCSFSDHCGTAVWTYIVLDNVELYRATTNLRSNLNEVTWKTSEEQADYISSVKIFRNNQLIATAPYADGIFTDNIGSESTQWQYHLQAVDNDGNDCPIPSYWKRTIHLDHVQGTQGNEILQWTPYEEENPAKDEVMGYGIYDVVGGEPRLIITVGDFTNVFAYNPADFDGYGTVAAVFSRDGEEDLAFSNLTGEVLEVNNETSTPPSIYPNPSNGTFTIEGNGVYFIYNTVGQLVKTVNVKGMQKVVLPSGLYFVRNDETTTKLVVR